ncbi:hypothetical protein DL765_006812 [Monosporascus sp. GIB2]|nr:hypothetical protein DL765_006812 [Monosporascus sp. GIB2]
MPATKRAAGTSRAEPEETNRFTKALAVLNWMPQRCRYDPKSPPSFTLGMNILLAFVRLFPRDAVLASRSPTNSGQAATFTVANLYYAQPILNVIAEEFGVSYERASNGAALSQAGYAVGLAFVCPIADMVPRRPFILFLIFMTATIWLGLCVTDNFSVFIALSFICGVGTVTPQLMLPLVGDLAPPHQRASSLSVVVSALALGLMIARVLSGIVANYTSWRNIYWLAFAAQYVTLGILFFTLPDYPAKNKGLEYFPLLRSMVVLVVKEPLLAQACFIGFMLSAAFTSFWTTLTFLLASPPYEYSSLEVGLFAFIGIAVILLAPVWSRLITDRFVQLFSVILGLLIDFTGNVIGTFTGTTTVAGPIVQAIMMDTGANFAHTANRSNVYSLDPKARNRINTAYMVFAFAGQLTGTAVGNRLYAEGGWVWSGSCNIAFLGAALIVAAIRGPRETGWIGWSGGWDIGRDDLPDKKNTSTGTERAVEEASATTMKSTGVTSNPDEKKSKG